MKLYATALFIFLKIVRHARGSTNNYVNAEKFIFAPQSFLFFCATAIDPPPPFLHSHSWLASPLVRVCVREGPRVYRSC